MRNIVLLTALLATGCAQVTPDMRQLADQRKGEQHHISVKLEPEDNFSKWCGYAKPGESVHCSQEILARKISKEAKDYCVFYYGYKVKWERTYGYMYDRMTSGSTTVTCRGSRNTEDKL